MLMFDTAIDTLRTRLQQAIELEFATIPPYLTALYTIKPDTNQAAADVIRSVVMEEMLHLTLAANLLNAVGGQPALNTPSFIPAYPLKLKFSDRNFPINLVRFSPEAIDTFLKIEMPTELVSNRSLMESRSLGFDEIDLEGRTIGEFYQDIICLIESLCDQFGEDRVFTGDLALQVGTQYYYGGGGVALTVTSREGAIKAIKVIMDQGEGSSDSLFDGDATFGQRAEVVHYFRFNEIKYGRYYQDTDTPKNPPSGPIMEVNYTDVYPMKLNPKQADYPEGSELWTYSGAFNEVYARFLNVLQQAFNGQPAILMEAVTLMWQLKYKALELIKNPIPGTDGLHAGPGFEYVHELESLHAPDETTDSETVFATL